MKIPKINEPLRPLLRLWKKKMESARHGRGPRLRSFHRKAWRYTPWLRSVLPLTR